MSRAIRTIIGLGLIAVSALAAGWAIYHLVRTGTCASGGPYVSARPCPEGTGLQLMALIGGIFGSMIGAAVSPLRGSAGVAWGLAFTLLGLGALAAGIGPARPPEGGTGLMIFGIAFGGFMILMGLGGFGVSVVASRGYRAARAAAQTFSTSRVATMQSAIGSPMVGVEGSGLTPEQARRVTDSLRSIGLGDMAGMVQQAVDRQGAGAKAFPVAPARDPEDLTDELAKLAQLHTSGALTDEEFQQAKSRLLGG